MSRIKFLIVLVFVLFVWVSTQIFADSLERKVTQLNKNYSVYHYTGDDVHIIMLRPRLKGLTLEYTTRGTSASYLGSLDNNCVAINGFYFGYKTTDTNTVFQPAWPIQIFTSLKDAPRIIASDTRPEDDINLHVPVFYNSWNNVVSIGKSILIGQGNWFHAGPLLVNQWKINDNLQQNRSHWRGKHYRTFLIQRANKQAIWWITRTKIDLPSLAKYLTEIMEDEEFTAVNLDGGSSTSLYTPEFSFNSSKKLPILYRMCQ